MKDSHFHPCNLTIAHILFTPVVHILFTFLFCLFTFLLSCEKNPTPIGNKTYPIQLTVEEVAVTEAWLRLQAEEVPEGATFQLQRNDSTTRHAPLTTDDTLLYDEGLLPARTYRYRAILQKHGKTIVKSRSATVQTMDTTSHDFSWEIFTFGNHHSVLRDVAIVNENNIYAVGEIYADSAQPWLPYNAVHWDGQQWKLKRIPYIYNGSPIISPIRWIFAFEKNDIFFGNSVHWDGKSFENIDIAISIFYGTGINKMWGTQNGELYVVGNQGKIAYSPDHGQSWQKLESPSGAGRGGTELPIQDIWGAVDPHTGEQDIVCIASNKYYNEERNLFHIEKGGVTPIHDRGFTWSLSSIWFIPYRIHLIGGDGIYLAKKLGLPWHKDISFPASIYKNSVRGQAINHIIVCGSCALLSHYNGLTWKLYEELINPTDELRSVAVTDECIVAEGKRYLNGIDRYGIIYLGRR